MNTLVRGQKEALVESCVSWPGSSRALFLRPSQTFPRCWDGVRGLVEELRERRGDAEVDAVLAQHRLAAGLVPGVLRIALDDEEQRASKLLGAVPESHLTHNLLVQSTLFSAWADLLADLLRDLDGPLVVPDLADLDRESLAALRALYRQYPDSSPRLLAGYDPSTSMGKPDENGLIWHDPAGDAHRLGLAFASREQGEVVDVETFRGSGEAESQEERDRRSFGGKPAIDERAFEALQVETTPKVDLVVQAMRAAFTCFGFTTVLRLGLDLLAWRPGSKDLQEDLALDLTQEQRADIHGLVALAAHNRQFRSNGNKDLAAFLEHHLTLAFDAETRPARRSCLCYRLAVTIGRRGKRFEAAKAWADRAIEEARRKELPPWQEAHLVAWARNIRAYLWMGLKELDNANADCEAAFQQLDVEVRGRALPAWQDPAPLVREIAYTHSLLADNLAALARLRGDDPGFAKWKQIADEIAEAAPGLVRFEAILWIELYRSHLRLDLALEKAEAGWRAAHLEQDPLRMYNYLVQRADLHDRRGELDAALDCFAEAITFRKRLGEPEILRPLAAITARVAWQAGRFDLARGYLGPLARGTDLETLSSARAGLALVSGLEGREEEAKEQINQAIELAVESGDRDTLLEVSIRAGMIARQLADHESARLAFEQALEIAETAPEIPSPAVFIFLARLHLAELVEGDSGKEALDLLPEALSDAETWSYLERLETLAKTAEARDQQVTLLKSAVEQRV